MTEFKANIFPEPSCRTLSDAINEQRSLIEVYAAREKRLKEPDFMDHQMATAYVAELAEYLAWMDRKEYLEAMFEAVDMWHFALEGLISHNATIDTFDAFGVHPADSRIAVLAVGQLLKSHNWKHWKTPSERKQEIIVKAYKTMLVLATAFFAKAHTRYCRKAKCKMHQHEKMLLACYFVKAEENHKRQAQGY